MHAGEEDVTHGLDRQHQDVDRTPCGRANQKDRGQVSAGLMPTEARGNYLPEAPYLRETKTYLKCNCTQPY